MTNLLPFISYVFITSFTPGPNNIMAMTSANRFGLRKTIRFNLGVFAGFFVIMLLCSYLTLVLSNLLPKFRLFMSLVGAAYMLYLAAKIVRSTENSDAGNNEALNSFWAGLGLQFLNPKGILYGVTVVANFILPYTKSAHSLILFSFLLGFVALLSTSSWAIFGLLFQRLLSNYSRPFNWVMGLLLLYCAVSVFL